LEIARPLFRRIQNQSSIFTEADREELMDFANKAATGGILFAALQEGARSAISKHQKAEKARKGNGKKAATWRAKVEELAGDLWVKEPKFIGYARNTADEIDTSLKGACPKAPTSGTVAKYLSKGDVRERLNKKIGSSN
jgi:hypothetical protein